MTSWPETSQMLGALGLTAERYSVPGVTNYSTRMHLPGSDIGVSKIYYVDEADTVSRIWVGSVTVRDGDWVYGDPEFVRAWSSYMPYSLWEAYGEPTQALVSITETPPEGVTMPFELLVHYANVGTLIRYYGVAERAADSLRVCPAGAHIELWLTPVGLYDTVRGIARVGPFLPPETLPDLLPFEDAVGESFADYAALADNADSACFVSPAELWP